MRIYGPTQGLIDQTWPMPGWCEGKQGVNPKEEHRDCQQVNRLEGLVKET